MNDASEFMQFDFASEASADPYQVGYQSWTPDNLCVQSYHNDISYYTCRWDALCPYIEVSEAMLAMAPRPFVVYALPPDSAFGVPINDRYGLAHTGSETFWNQPRRQRKFKELDKLFRHFQVTEEVIAGHTLSVSQVLEMGGDHLADCYIPTRMRWLVSWTMSDTWTFW